LNRRKTVEGWLIVWRWFSASVARQASIASMLSMHCIAWLRVALSIERSFGCASSHDEKHRL
jgi:hypothetical protein